MLRSIIFYLFNKISRALSQIAHVILFVNNKYFIVQAINNLFFLIFNILLLIDIHVLFRESILYLKILELLYREKLYAYTLNR